MNLFNIGVDGQYRVAAFAAAVVAGEAWLPGYLNTALGDLARDGRRRGVGRHRRPAARHARRQRGHLDDHAERHRDRRWSAYLLRKVAVREEGSNIIATKDDPRGQPHPGHPVRRRPGRGLRLRRDRGRSSASLYWFLLNRTRFGFDLRATGQSRPPPSPAASTSSRMIDRRDAALRRRRRPGRHADPVRRRHYAYGSTFQSGLGFAGIAIALLGRNHPVGIAIGALLFAFLDEQSNPLQILLGVSPGHRRDHPGRRSC